MNLNGTWQFEIDHGASGRARGLIDGAYSREITVPFCPESRLSGVEYKDFMAAVWYRRTFTLPEEAQGKRVLLHFGAVDFRCEAWVNGKSVGVHEGGYVSFTFEITDALVPGENTMTSAPVSSPTASSPRAMNPTAAATPAPPASGRRCGLNGSSPRTSVRFA